MSITYRNEPQDTVAPFVAARLRQQLERGKRVLWLLSGGSGGEVCIAASKLLADVDTSRLFMTMTDERYGEVGHPNENVQLLIDGGLELHDATFYRPLRGASLHETAQQLGAWIDEAQQSVDTTIAVLGIGADAHTCGIKPLSSATSSTETVAGFAGDDFERITVTTQFLPSIDEAIVQAYGASKHDVIRLLLAGEGDPRTYPMLTIREIPKVTVFSDTKEEIA